MEGQPVAGALIFFFLREEFMFTWDQAVMLFRTMGHYKEVIYGDR